MASGDQPLWTGLWSSGKGTTSLPPVLCEGWTVPEERLPAVEMSCLAIAAALPQNCPLHGEYDQSRDRPCPHVPSPKLVTSPPPLESVLELQVPLLPQGLYTCCSPLRLKSAWFAVVIL